MTDFSPDVEAAIARTRTDVATLHAQLTKYGLVKIGRAHV